ncbi:MAG: DUF6798 domain-containing protein [Pirellulales bacterium]
MNDQAAPSRPWQAIVEVLLIFAIFFLHGAYAAPDSNEAHYLTKAKHHWNPGWAAGDFFLDSADAHQVFYWSFGWLTLWLSLEQAAWVGRVLTWLLLAWSWQRLSAAAVPRPWLSVLAAAVFVGLNENAHMAGEWVIGGFEAKGFSYALVLFALARIVRGEWGSAWLLLGGATALHVLVGGWAMVAAAAAWLASGDERPRFQTLLPALTMAVALALPSVYFGLSLSGSADAATIAEANRIYVFERLPHHLSAMQLAPGFLTRHLLLQAVWLLMITFMPAAWPGSRALRCFVATTIAISWIGLGLNVLLQDRPEWLASVLRYYWFRASDAFVPLGVAVELAAMITVGLGERGVVAATLARSHRGALGARRGIAPGWLAGAVVLATIDSVIQLDHLPFRVPIVNETPATPRADKNVNYSDWMDVCGWVVEHTEPDAIVLTPRSAATFKWYTGRPEVATWKDVPQDARSIVEWWDRMIALHATGESDPRWYKSFSEQGPERLRALMERYGARYVIVPLRDDVAPLAIEPLYENDSFAVYRREQLEFKH